MRANPGSQSRTFQICSSVQFHALASPSCHLKLEVKTSEASRSKERRLNQTTALYYQPPSKRINEKDRCELLCGVDLWAAMVRLIRIPLVIPPYCKQGLWGHLNVHWNILQDIKLESSSKASEEDYSVLTVKVGLDPTEESKCVQTEIAWVVDEQKCTRALKLRP